MVDRPKALCSQCSLEERPQVKDEVNGSLILFVGIAPGYTEERKGRPFVGKSGRLLRETLRFVGIRLSQVSFANLVHCFPQDWESKARDPSENEIKACENWLVDTIRRVNPKWLVPLGRIPTEWCLGRKVSITRVAGVPVNHNIYGDNYTIFPLPHPAYITRNVKLLQGYRTSFQRLADVVYEKDLKALYQVKEYIEYPNNKVFFDIECNHTNPFANDWKLLCYTVGNANREVLAHPNRDVLEDKGLTKIGHNIKFDIHGLRKAGVRVRGKLEDVMLAHYLATGMVEGKTHSHSLKAIAREYGVPVEQVKEIDVKHTSDVPREERLDYNRNDVALTALLYEKIPHNSFVYKMLSDSLPMLVDMEWRGMHLDQNRVQTLFKEGQQKLEALLTQLRKEVGSLWGEWVFNPNSSPQVVKVLTKLGVKLPTTKKGNPTTRGDILKGIDHPLARLLLEWRGVSKLTSTYLAPYLGKARLHTTYNLHTTDTGRLSSTNPNLQNVPIESTIRRMFIAPEGYTFVSIDYSQIEPRVWGALSGEKELLNVPDIYVFMHQKTFGRPPTKRQRDMIKIVVLGTMYGMGSQARAEALGITEAEATQFLGELKRAFPRGFEWIHNQLSFAKKHQRVNIEYTERWRDLSREPKDRLRRLAVNTPIQSIASDITLKSATSIYMARIPGVRLANLIHDEISLYIKTELLSKAIPELQEIMRETPGDIIPVLRGKLKVDVEIGPSWGELSPYSV